jgi:hypothetical protein
MESFFFETPNPTSRMKRGDLPAFGPTLLLTTPKRQTTTDQNSKRGSSLLTENSLITTPHRSPCLLGPHSLELHHCLQDLPHAFLVIILLPVPSEDPSPMLSATFIRTSAPAFTLFCMSPLKSPAQKCINKLAE